MLSATRWASTATPVNDVTSLNDVMPLNGVMPLNDVTSLNDVMALNGVTPLNDVHVSRPWCKVYRFAAACGALQHRQAFRSDAL